MQNIHKFDDTQEAGSQTDESMGPTFQKADITDLVNEAFDIFLFFMWKKMQQTNFVNEEMIEECIDVSKYAMKQKISEQ